MVCEGSIPGTWEYNPVTSLRYRYRILRWMAVQ